MTSTVLRRKVVRPRVADEPAGSAPARGLPRAVMRAISEGAGLSAQVGAVAQRRATLDEGLERIEDDGFVALLAQGGAAGLAVLGADLFAALIEALTLGRLGAAGPAAPRRPTSTDAALMGAVVDRMLAGLETADGEGPWRMVRAVGDLRVLAAILDEGDYELVDADVRVTAPRGPEGARGGALMLLLPVPAPAPVAPPVAGPDPFEAGFEAAVAGAEVVLKAVLGRIGLPLERALALQVGDRLELPLSRLEEVEVLGLDARPQARGRLGQAQGQRALRVTALVDGD